MGDDGAVVTVTVPVVLLSFIIGGDSLRTLSALPTKGAH